jgi:hypothetical protein
MNHLPQSKVENQYDETFDVIPQSQPAVAVTAPEPTRMYLTPLQQKVAGEYHRLYTLVQQWYRDATEGVDTETRLALYGIFKAVKSALRDTRPDFYHPQDWDSDGR